MQSNTSSIHSRNIAVLAHFYEEMMGVAIRLKKLEARLGIKFNPNQPRVPAGSAEGGQWTSGGGVALNADSPSIDSAISFLLSNAEATSQSACAAYVRRA